MSSIEKIMARLEQNNRGKTESDGVTKAAESVPLPLAGRQRGNLDYDLKTATGEAEVDERKPYAGERGEKKPLALQLDRLEAAGYLAQDYEGSCQFSEFRRIKRPILKKAFSGERSADELPGNLVMISSAVPGEGKTFCAINLTLNMILERDITVMLMDVDCMRRSLSKLFGVDGQPGLVDVLEGECSIEDVIVNTAIPQLKIFPAGRAHKHSAELLAGDRMKRLTAEIAERYSDRIILMDAPPLLAANDAEILTHYAGQAVIVVEADQTSQSLVQQALMSIEREKISIGLVLNKRQGGRLAENDGYGYYYTSDGDSRAG